MLKKLSEKLGAKFPATTPGCSMLKITCLDDALSVRSFLTTSKPSRRSITAAKTREKEKKERQKKNSKNQKALRCKSLSRPKNFDFCACQSYNALKRDAGGKKGKLLCCKRILDQIKGNLAQIQPNKHQKVQRTHFLQKVPGVNGLMKPLLAV